MFLLVLVGSFQELDKDGTGTAEMNLTEVLWLDLIFSCSNKDLRNTLLILILSPSFCVVALYDHVWLRPFHQCPAPEPAAKCLNAELLMQQSRFHYSLIRIKCY